MAGSGWKRPSFRSRQGSEGWSSLGPQRWVGVAGERSECPQNRRDVGNESGVAQSHSCESLTSCPINPCTVGLSHEHRQVLDDLCGESLDISMAPPGDVDASGDDADWEEVGELTGDQAMAQSIHELVAQQYVPSVYYLYCSTILQMARPTLPRWADSTAMQGTADSKLAAADGVNDGCLPPLEVPSSPFTSPIVYACSLF